MADDPIFQEKVDRLQTLTTGLRDAVDVEKRKANLLEQLAARGDFGTLPRRVGAPAPRSTAILIAWRRRR